MKLFTRRITSRIGLDRVFGHLVGLWVLAALAAPSAAFALSPVTVLAIDGQDSEGESASPSLYDSARTQVALHPGLSLNDVPPQALQELLLAAGCSALNDACAEDLGELLGSRWLLWGFANAAGVVLHLRDLTGEHAERSVRLNHVPATEREEILLVRRLLWGDIGVLAVSSDPPGAEVFLDGTLAGVTPLRLEGQSPGLVTLRLVSPTHAIFERVVEVDINDSIVNVTLAPMIAAAPPRPQGSAVPSAYLAASATLLVSGIATALSANQTQNRFDEVLARPVLDRGRASTLETRGTRRATAANVLIPLGSVGTVGSAAWLLVRRGQRDRNQSNVTSDIGAWSRYHGTALHSGTSNDTNVAE